MMHMSFMRRLLGHYAALGSSLQGVRVKKEKGIPITAMRLCHALNNDLPAGRVEIFRSEVEVVCGMD
jgi:hypothetical protein